MKIQVHGHRGCRAYMPENTIDGFQKAIDLGVDALELDVVVSKDHEIVVSHEPYFSSQISLDPFGKLIPSDEQLTHNLYQKNYEEIKTYDVGIARHDKFPEQQNKACYKPLLSEVFEVFNSHDLQENQDLCLFNIEVKFHPLLVPHYYPNEETFAKLLVNLVTKHKMTKRVIIQSFDYNILKWVKKLDDRLFISALNDKVQTAEECILELGFLPQAYGPDHTLLKQEDLNFCQKNGIQLIPWTVNEPQDIQKMIAFEVDGIISDYPDRVIQQLKEITHAYHP